MINESLKNAFKEMWKKNLNLLDISKSDLNSHISNDHPCHYAESASIGGPASSAVKLDSSAGDFNTPVYFSGGRPVACTSLDLNTSGNAATATALKNSGMLDTQEKIDGFIAANAIKYATFKTTDSNNVNMASNDGMIISIPWTSNSYGAQLAFDDTQDATIKVRGYSSSWGDWKTLLNSSNYTNYTVKKDGTGASGTWGIGISGNAATATALTTSAGSATQPIYFLNGKPVACTYTLGKSVPSNAEFTDTTYNNATTSTDGLMSSSDKTKLNGIAAGATKTTVDSALSSTSTNPVQNKVIYGAISSKADLDTSGKVLSSQLPSYVDDVLEYSAKSNFPSTGESGKIYVDTATNLTYRWSGSAYVEISQSLALGETSSTAYRGDRGKIAYDHSQTSHAPTNAEVNQNAFSNVKVGSTTVSADSKTDTLELVAGTNVTLTPDATNDKVTITTNDTKNTAGSTNTNDKIFLVGATSQAANPQTYSHDTAYVGTDGCLYSNNTKVSIDGHTHSYAGSSSAGGSANSAVKLDSSAGSATQPVYFSSGKPVACTYTLSKSVPSDAVFTDTNTKVTQTAITASGYTNWRPLVIGASNNSTEGFSPTTVTDTTFTVNTISCQPSSGTIKATTFKGNASTATKLATAKTIALGTGATGTATSFDGSNNITIPVTSVKEAYLSWGGKNFSGAYGPIDAAMVPDLGANRLAFMPAAGVEVQYSRDGGSTWSTYSTTDADKINLFNGNGAGHSIGANSATGIDKSNYQLRITITTNTAKVYTALNKFVIYCSTNGSSGSWCTIDGKTKANVDSGTDTWVTFANKVSLSGWSGYNVINTPDITTYGNTSAQHQKLRFTFGVTSHPSSSAYSGLIIYRIMGFGGNGWTTPSTMAATGRMYTYDASQNVTFPAAVSATTLYSNSTKVSVEGHTHTVANISGLTATVTELNYCDGVTSNIQT
ncbi:MAG: hypothetical protein ACI4W0_05720 [Bacilli bacterium]